MPTEQKKLGIIGLLPGDNAGKNLYRVLEMHVEGKPRMLIEPLPAKGFPTMLMDYLSSKKIPYKNIKLKSSVDEKESYGPALESIADGIYKVDGMGFSEIDMPNNRFGKVHGKSTQYDLGPSKEFEPLIMQGMAQLGLKYG